MVAAAAPAVAAQTRMGEATRAAVSKPLKMLVCRAARKHQAKALMLARAVEPVQVVARLIAGVVETRAVVI